MDSVDSQILDGCPPQRLFDPPMYSGDADSNANYRCRMQDIQLFAVGAGGESWIDPLSQNNPVGRATGIPDSAIDHWKGNWIRRTPFIK
jgi:hypothetical protein